MTRNLTLGLLLTSVALVGATPTNAMSFTINTPDTCTLSYCDGMNVACVEALCVITPFTYIDVSCQVCNDLSEAACGKLPSVCEAVGILASMPVGTCTFAYCDWEGIVCVEVDTPTCADPNVPAACVLSMCDAEGTACIWTDANPDGDCLSNVKCTASLCKLTALSLSMGACAGNPQAYDYDNPDCQGGIMCVDMPANKQVGDFCMVFYWFA